MYSKTKGWDLFQHIEEETTGIDAVTSNESKKDTYNLAGQKVSEGYKGIVIVNGKKVVVK